MTDAQAKGTFAAAAVLAVVTALCALAISISIDTTPDGSKTVKIEVNKKPGGQPTSTIPVPAPLVREAALTLESDLKNEDPPEALAVAPQQLANAKAAAEVIAATVPPLPTAGASAGVEGCTTKFVGNQSSRRGVRPQLQVLHYTVSPNRTGWSDVWAVAALFNRASSQASSNFIIDGEGHCAYIVPIESKAWTQAAGNPFSVSYEIINSGRESQFIATAGLNKLRSVMRQVSRRTGIPMRAGSVSGCLPLRTGIVQHKDFGICGGGHVDISPFNAAQVTRLLATPTCDAICQHRARVISLRTRNRAVHRALKSSRCSSNPAKSHGNCLKLHRRHQAIHRAARRERVSL